MLYRCSTGRLLGWSRGWGGWDSGPGGISLIPFEDPNETRWFWSYSSLLFSTMEFHSLMSSPKSAIR